MYFRLNSRGFSNLMLVFRRGGGGGFWWRNVCNAFPFSWWILPLEALRLGKAAGAMAAASGEAAFLVFFFCLRMKKKRPTKWWFPKNRNLRNFQKGPPFFRHYVNSASQKGDQSQNCIRYSSLCLEGLWNRPKYINTYIIYYIYGGFLKWWYPTTMGFPTKNDHFGVFWGYRHLRKHPYVYIYI